MARRDNENTSMKDALSAFIQKNKLEKEGNQTRKLEKEGK